MGQSRPLMGWVARPASGGESVDRGLSRGAVGLLLERVREGFVRLDAGEVNVFGLDELIQRHKRSAAELWSFSGSSGDAWVRAARTLPFLRDRADEPDWWEAGAPRRRRGRED